MDKLRIVGDSDGQLWLTLNRVTIAKVVDENRCADLLETYGKCREIPKKMNDIFEAKRKEMIPERMWNLMRDIESY